MDKINRHNYEAFFLLYTDDELSVAEKRMVEEFVDANPDLQEELVMLQQSILKPDSIVFEDKESLLRKEFIPGRTQEKLLLYLDNELTAAEEKEMDVLINADAGVKAEWDLLQHTKLSPGKAIVFEDKKSLYRREPGRVAAFPFRRVAAAAILIGFGLWGGLLYLSKDAKLTFEENNTGTTNNIKKVAPRNEANPRVGQTPLPDQSLIVKKLETPIVEKHEVAGIRKNSKKIPIATKASRQKTEPPRLQNSDMPVAGVNEKTNNLPTPYFHNLNKIESNKTVPADVTNKKQPVEKNEFVNNKDQYPVNTYASIASFSDNDDDKHSRVLFMDEEKIKKTGLGGIFRKVKRVIGRSANIKPGDNKIKVANLEFAIQ